MKAKVQTVISLIIVCLCFFCISSANTIQASGYEKSPGDLNGDNTVSVADAVLFIRFITEDSSLTLSVEGIQYLDLDSDGSITLIDVELLLRNILSMQCDDNPEAVATETTAEITQQATTCTTAINTDYVLNLRTLPSYDQEPFVTVNLNRPYYDVNTIKTTAFEYYSSLDDLGRCGVCEACIGQELMPTEKRGSIGMVKPSGWQLSRYDGIVEGNYLFNRCHLIGYQLTGENANVCNLITGTRYLNVIGMLPFENQTAEYIKSTGNHVYYRVTPYFETQNLVATGVLIEASSIEDFGTGLQFNVFCYNVQPRIFIDYATGDNHLIELTEEQKEEVPIQNADYVVNTNTKKFHLPSCSSLSDMNIQNRWNYCGNREVLISQGYTPCKRCNP